MGSLIPLAHGALGPFDELIPVLIAGLLALVLLVPILTKRKEKPSISSPENFETRPCKPSETADDHFVLR
ncbi:MAG TPA: hypothetical protein VMT24_15305 [Aggregatilineaceae bacterium]|nr:hypothetical protein [Aggregatilineaceae bacterium]